MLSGWGVKCGVSHHALSWGNIPSGKEGCGERRESWNDPSSPRRPGWQAVFFPKVTQLLRAPRSAGTYFVNTHLLERCLQHLEVVDVFML